MNILFKRLKIRLIHWKNLYSVRGKEKIFCIGAGKTGTTSLEKALKDFGYIVGNQQKAEMLIHEYGKRNFEPLFNLCSSAQAFQDAPFCFKYTFIALDFKFPKAKFILTVRDSDDIWYNSLVKFHSKVHNRRSEVPTIADLKKATYRYIGYAWDVRQIVFGIKEGQDPYDKEVLKKYYNDHNNSIIDYFKSRDNLLVINLNDKGSYSNLCNFLNKKPLYDNFPWENKTIDKVSK